jgi:hypothetical protein
MASTSRAMPADRPSAVSIIVSTTNPATTSRIPLGRSQARVSASDAGGLRPNVPEIRSGEIGLALEKARKRVKRGNAVESVAAAYLEFAASSPALYEVMFSLSLSVPFDDAATPPELHFAFSQLLKLFQGQSSKPEVISELFWASLHGIAELTRTKRSPRSRQKERVRALVELFTFPNMNRHRW